MLASDIIGGVRSTLFDPAPGVGWSDSELIGYINEALRTTASVKPDMYTVRGFIALVAGEYQQLPADGIALLDVDRNSDASGGRVITQVDADILAESARFWPASTKQAQVEHYLADPRSPRRFRVFPPNDGTGVVNVVYGATPPALAAVGDTVPVSEAYQGALTAYTLSKAYSKPSTRADATKTQMYMAQWGQLVGLKSKGQVAVAPTVTDSPGLK